MTINHILVSHTGVSNPVPKSFSRYLWNGQLQEKITGNEVVLFHLRDF